MSSTDEVFQLMEREPTYRPAAASTSPTYRPAASGRIHLADDRLICNMQAPTEQKSLDSRRSFVRANIA
jgi:hypothetical protein